MTVIEQEETVEKYCSKCKTDKSIADFYRNKSRYDGVDSYCKSCSNLLKVDFRKTKKGLISVIYGHQVSHSKARGHNAPNYTKKELINWCLSQIKFHSLYYLWVESNYNKWDSPSCDRKDDYKPYSLNNLQLLTWLENKRKSELDRKNGVLNKTNKAIKQFDINGNFIKRYFSISEASRTINKSASHISSHLSGKYKTAHGFIWKYELN